MNKSEIKKVITRGDTTAHVHYETLPVKDRKGTAVEGAYVLMEDNWIHDDVSMLMDNADNIYNIIRCQQVKTLKGKMISLLELDRSCPVGTILYVAYEITKLQMEN